MKVQFDQTDNLNATLIIQLGKEDYAEKVDKELRTLQKSMAIRGFRPGKAPIEMVKRYYGKSILSEEIQRLASDSLQQYIEEHNLDILGGPLSSDKVKSEVDVEKGEEFTFAFDLGLAPSFEINIGPADRLEQFVIAVDEAEIDKDIDYMRRRLGSVEPVETAEADDVITGTLTELGDDGQPLEGGLEEKEFSITPSLVQDDALRNTLIGIQSGAEQKVNIFQLFNNNDAVIKNTLGIATEAIADLSMDFLMKIKEVKRRNLAELNAAYYEEIYGLENAPQTEEEYREKVRKNLADYYANEANLWLDHQITDLINQKHALELPSGFLKRWLLASKPEEYNAGNIDERFAAEASVLVRHLVVEKISIAHELKVNEDELRQTAYEYVADLYRQYGLMNAGNMIVEYAEKQLKDADFRRTMADRVLNRKAYDTIRGMVTLEPRETTVAEYFDHINKHKHEH